MPKLTNIVLKQLVRQPGRYADAETRGLYIQVRPGSASWLYRYTENGRERMAGLGAYPFVGLAEARAAALALRKVRHEGLDPLAERRKAQAASAPVQTFESAAEVYIQQMGPSWAKGRDFQWRSSLRRYAYPTLGNLPVDAITTDQVLAVLTPVWTRAPETGSKLRGRIAAVIDSAAARSGSERGNPARWAGHLSHLLPSHINRVVEHHASLRYEDAPAFYRKLMQREGVASRQLAFVMLTACRSGEARLATWAEVEGSTWTLPAARAKTKKELRIPLSTPTLAILDEMRALREQAAPGDYIFPSKARSKSLSNRAMIEVLRRMGRDDLTVHGFRATFRIWCSEIAKADNAVAELSLGHSVGGRVFSAYMRSDLYEARAALMQQWSEFLLTTPQMPCRLPDSPPGTPRSP